MPIAINKLKLGKIKKIGESLIAEVYFAQDKNTKAKFLIKKINPDFVLDGVKEHIEQQLTHLNRLAIPGLLIPQLQVDGDHDLQLIQPYPEGQLLRDWLTEQKQVDIRTVLEIGIALADCLVLRHRATLIHRAIKPNNIVIQENPIRIQLVGEVLIIDGTQLSQVANNPHYRRETMPYTAPEMSGRIRTNVDYCSDLYSVGTVLFECLTGVPPFLSDDPLSIVHSHLAEEPRPVTELNEQCPEILSDIIARLLLKQPEKRYQSAIGLRADLQTCLSTLKMADVSTQKTDIPTFQLRQHESRQQITIPSIMVGRDLQQQQLLDEYQRVCDGNLGFVSVSAISGMGKTRMIQELELPIVANRGYFTFGKFDQFSTQLPYSAFHNAFSRLIRQILTEDAERIAYWRIRMLDALETSGQLVTTIMPELEAIIGKQPDLQRLSAVDELNRFINLFSRFMGCLASEEHPLVLFLDDLQWCDQGTLELLEVIYSHPENHPYLLIIGAYRDNEVDENHPVIQMETAIEQSSQPLLKIHLDPLDKTAANQMVAHMLSTRPSSTQKLTDSIYPVTGGNPLYISESLRWLHEGERLQLSETGNWSSNNSAIEGVELPGNAKDLFVDKQKSFPENVRDLLATGALLGAQFEAIDLADIHEISLPELYETLRGVFDQRILQIEMGHLYFFHDQIQAAAANFLDGEQQKLRHRLIARIFINRIGSSSPEVLLSTPRSQLFSIVEHLAAGRVEHSTDEERVEEAYLNYYAGLAAMATLALDACNHYLSQSLELCPDNTWDSDYEFMLSLHKNLAHAALVTGDQKRANEIVAISIEHVHSDLDKAEFLYEQSIAFAALGDLHQAIEITVRALAMLDYELPLTDAEIQQEIIETQARLYSEGRDIWQEVLSAPPVEGRLNTLIQKLYGELMGYLYFTGDLERTKAISLRSIDFSAKNGVDDFTCYALGCMILIHSLADNYPYAYKYESAALELIKKYPDTFGAVKAKGTLVWTTLHLRRSASYLRAYCHDAAIEGIGCGELRYGSLQNCVEQWYGFILGDDIPLLESELKQTNHFAQQHNIAISQSLSEAIQLSIRPLLEQGMFYGEDPGITETIQMWVEEEQTVAVACYFVLSGIAAYYNHRYVEAEALLIQAEPFLPALTTSVLERLWFLFRYLIGLKNGFEGEVESYLDRLFMWSSHGPMLKPYMALIEAEIIVKSGDFKETRNGYLDAIDSAHQEGYLLLEAFLNERLYQHLQASNHHSSELYRNQANQLYQSCGVVNRVASPDVVVLPSATGRSDALVKSTLPAQTGQNIDDAFDVQFLFDAVKTISSELDLDKLMGTILTSVMARLGAKTGYLLIAKDGLLQPRFKAIKTDTVAVISDEETTFDTDNLCSAIVNYAFNSKKKVILKNAMEIGEFVADKTVQKSRLRSVLCIPIIMQTEVLGVLFFENSLIESVFTENQVSHADLLTSQAAIALQNSKLLHDTQSAQNVIAQMNTDLEATVKERTKELQRKQLELTHAGRLASLGELATGIAHELGQPLQIIQAASRIIEDELKSDEFDKSEVLPFTKDIAEQIERATAIVSNMRSYARNDDDMAAEHIDISIPFHQCLVFFTEQLQQHQINLVLEIKDDLPNVLVNPQKFQQIVVNLFSNARYAVDKKSPNSSNGYHKQIISRLYPTSDGKSVVLEVEDNGIGMTEEIREKCMDPFYTTKEVGEGTGLGLSIVHGLIKEFGFSLHVTSQPNIGSLFQVTMPVSSLN